MTASTLLEVVVGSQAHRLAREDSDWDYRSVYQVPTEEFLKVGVEKVRDTVWNEGKEEDATGWEVGHFLNLAIHSNPTILEVFVAPSRVWHEKCDACGVLHTVFYNHQELRDLFPYVWSAEGVLNAFTGYGHNQRKKFFDKTTTAYRRPKYAVAFLRVLYQGTMLLGTGNLPISMVYTPVYETLLKWREGDFTLGEVIDVTAEWEEKIRAAYMENHSINPKVTDLDKVNEFLVRLRKNGFTN